tara:strand:- start:1029 stop:1640 length:612 start_codon:yes stop_codon:yes gene_type:complete
MNYWNKYYKKNLSPSKPTRFAFFCKNKLKKFKGKVFDIGCGNGRDVAFFNKNKIDCYGVDLSKKAILKNKKKYKLIKDKFLNRDFSKLNISQFKTDIAIYSRFSLHSINKKKEKNLIRILNSSKNIKLVMIETRTIYDELFGKGHKIGKNEFITSHYRRFIDPKIIKKDINKSFKIEYFKLDKNLAKFKKENPKVLRIVGTKK